MPRDGSAEVPRALRTRAGGLLRASIPILLVGLACARPTPTGPLFVGPWPPAADAARVYLYRVDEHHSYSRVEIRFDGEEPLVLLDEEYAAVDLAHGVHEVEFRLRNAFWGGGRWRKQVLRARRGETLYLEVSVAVDERNVPSGRELEIPGRESVTAGENVTAELRDSRRALSLLARTHRLDDRVRR